MLEKIESHINPSATKYNQLIQRTKEYNIFVTIQDERINLLIFLYNWISKIFLGKKMAAPRKNRHELSFSLCVTLKTEALK